jgi:hypothetical protein
MPVHCPSATAHRQNKSTTQSKAAPTLPKSAVRVLVLEDRTLEEESEPRRGMASSALSSTAKLVVRDKTDGDQVALNLRDMCMILVGANPL